MRLELVRCGREPLSICERYDWLILPPRSSLWMASMTSCCVMARPRLRRVPSTSLRYRIFSPSFILQIAMYILQFVIEEVKRWIWLVFSSLLRIEHRCAGKAVLWLPPYAGRGRCSGRKRRQSLRSWRFREIQVSCSPLSFLKHWRCYEANSDRRVIGRGCDVCMDINLTRSEE